MTGNRLTDSYPSQPSEKPNRFYRDIPKAQQTIYNFLLEIVKEWSPEDVLAEFKHLFIDHVNTVSSHTLPSLYEIVFSNQEQEFRNTLKRSCYILINNWDLARNHKSIQELIQLFSNPIIDKHTLSPTLQRLRSWLKAFVTSRDFQELQLFASKYEDRENAHWSQRYASYLLVPQYIDLNNPIEQRQAARTLSRQLKEKFKFDLAMYTARSQSVTSRERMIRNPTGLGDEVLRLIKTIVARRGAFSYANLANIFINQTQKVSYREFKQSLQKYLVYSVEHHDYAKALNAQLTEKLNLLYKSHHSKPIDDALLLRTCNRVIEYLTTENHVDPSPLFILLLSQGNPLTLVVVLLKIVLICRHARTHLEARIADLIQYYEEVDEEDCRWVVNFFEIFKITMAIYTENIEFNLVSMNGSDAAEHLKPALGSQLDTYRIFSQPKSSLSLDLDSEILELGLLETLSEELEKTTNSQEEFDSQ